MSKYFNIKTIKKAMPYLRWIISIVLTMFVFVTVVKAEDSNGNPVMVSMGDSYSSGEGIEPFYDQNTEHKEESQDWMAHRSEKSWCGRLTLKRKDGSRITMSDYKDNNWFFVADSGAKTWHLYNHYDKDWSFDILNHDKTSMDAQLDVFNKISDERKTVDFVTLTIGGNNAGFADIIGEAASSFTYTVYLQPSHLSDTLKNTWHDFYKEGGIRDEIKNSYYDIASKAGDEARIIVAGYPKLISEQSTSTLFESKEARMINNAVHDFNAELKTLVDNCREPSDGKDKAINIYFASVEEEFAGHEAYSRDPYINEIMFGAQKQELTFDAPYSSYSIHPNDKGAQVYAECVQKKIDSLIAEEQGDERVQESEEEDKNNRIIDFDINGSWATSDGVHLSFNKDGTYDLDWSFGISESGNYSIGEINGTSFPIIMEGSSILQMMQLVYGGTNTDYHFEILVNSNDQIYLVQVYDDYTAETSPCKLRFTRQ